MPTGARGWAAMIGFVLANMLILIPLMRLGRTMLPPIALVPIMLVLMTGTILGFMRWVVIARGREVSGP